MDAVSALLMAHSSVMADFSSLSGGGSQSGPRLLALSDQTPFANIIRVILLAVLQWNSSVTL